MVFKICEGMSYFSFAVEELDVIVHKNYFLVYPYSFFLPFCAPHLKRTWWLRWELGIVNVSYYEAQVTHTLVENIEHQYETSCLPVDF